MNVKVKIESESERVDEKILLTYVQLCETGSVAKLCLALLQLSFELVKIRKRIFSTCLKRTKQSWKGISYPHFIFTSFNFYMCSLQETYFTFQHTQKYDIVWGRKYFSCIFHYYGSVPEKEDKIYLENKYVNKILLLYCS